MPSDKKKGKAKYSTPTNGRNKSLVATVCILALCVGLFVWFEPNNVFILDNGLNNVGKVQFKNNNFYDENGKLKEYNSPVKTTNPNSNVEYAGTPTTENNQIVSFNDHQHQQTQFVNKGNTATSSISFLSEKSPEKCKDVCDSRRSKRLEVHGGDLLNGQDLQRMLSTAKDKMIAKLKQKYGAENFDRIFLNKDENPKDGDDVLLKYKYRGFTGAVPGGMSWQRMKRRLIMKFLRIQKAIQAQDSNLQGCDCINGNIPATKPPLPDTEVIPFYDHYVWVTSGHSSSAGHGNLYNETYTAFLEDQLKEVFESVGIGFEARNYAMGATPSTPEYGMCLESIVGDDADSVTYDFGLTDNRIEYLLHYGYRVGVHPSFPTLIALHTNGGRMAVQHEYLREFELRGMSVFIGVESLYEEMTQSFPDTAEMTQAEIDALPPYVKNFRCGDKIEAGDPYCDASKYTDICPKRWGKGRWHPGWKWHAFEGTKMALFLSELFSDALNEFVNSQKDSDEWLAELQGHQERSMQYFKESPLPEAAAKLGSVLDDTDHELFFKGHNFCHTALIPSRIRFLGYLTNTDKVGSVAALGMETYDTGMSKLIAEKGGNQGVMRLAYNPFDRQECPVPLTPDHKDYFFSSGNDPYNKITIPNPAEIKAYNYDPEKVKGMVIICLGLCVFTSCQPEEILIDDIRKGAATLMVNGGKVVSYSDLDNGCFILEGADEQRYWNKNSEGVFEISVTVANPEKYLLIYSFVIY